VMAKQTGYHRQLWVYADWMEPGDAAFMGMLTAGQLRGKGVFSFSYSKEWLEGGGINTRPRSRVVSRATLHP